MSTSLSRPSLVRSALRVECAYRVAHGLTQKAFLDPKWLCADVSEIAHLIAVTPSCTRHLRWQQATRCRNVGTMSTAGSTPEGVREGSWHGCAERVTTLTRTPSFASQRPVSIRLATGNPLAPRTLHREPQSALLLAPSGFPLNHLRLYSRPMSFGTEIACRQGFGCGRASAAPLRFV